MFEIEGMLSIEMLVYIKRWFTFSGIAKSLDESVKADLAIHPPSMKWSHTGPFNSLDHSSIRRGYQVYKQVCSACHSMRFISYRHLRDIAFTEAELKAEAAEIQVSVYDLAC